MAEEGIYIKNTKMNPITYRAQDSGLAFTLRPRGENGDLVYIPGKYSDDMGIRRLIARKLVVEVEKEAAVKREESQYKAENEAKKARRSETAEALEEDAGDLVQVQCSGITQSGGRCKRKVTVKASENKDGNEFFCSTHEPEDQ